MRRGMQGHVAGPREPMRGAGGAQVARTRGVGHTSPRGCPGDATWQGGWHLEGPRVSGPWLGVWGGNANVLSRSSFYTYTFRFFYSVWDYVPAESLFSKRHGGTMDVGCDRDAFIVWTRSPPDC